ncbi:hypothetical protein QQF64_020957 [Cirrhinus molitorella]|uniref:Uncharacterized protein n=1 Tax=Cirrhinus molitorella TaxID=172907 RepID=A0ABR3LAP4_9TELE
MLITAVEHADTAASGQLTSSLFRQPFKTCNFKRYVGCVHVRSGMCAAVEASPSAQIVAHLSNCLQDLNAALLLRKREAISFSPWLRGVEERRKAQGSML